MEGMNIQEMMKALGKDGEGFDMKKLQDIQSRLGQFQGQQGIRMQLSMNAGWD